MITIEFQSLHMCNFRIVSAVLLKEINLTYLEVVDTKYAAHITSSRHFNTINSA